MTLVLNLSLARDVLLSLYYALFHSHLSYATNVWALNANSTKRILNLQKKAVRLMTFSDFDAHSLPLFTQLRMLSFHDFTKFTNIIFIFNLLNYNLPAPLYDTFHLHDMTHLNLRRPCRAKTGLLRLPKVTTVRFGNHSLTWNLLQQYINIDDLSTLSLKKLKYLAKFYFLSSYI